MEEVPANEREADPRGVGSVPTPSITLVSIRHRLERPVGQVERRAQACSALVAG